MVKEMRDVIKGVVRDHRLVRNPFSIYQQLIYHPIFSQMITSSTSRSLRLPEYFGQK